MEVISHPLIPHPGSIPESPGIDSDIFIPPLKFSVKEHDIKFQMLPASFTNTTTQDKLSSQNKPPLNKFSKKNLTINTPHRGGFSPYQKSPNFSKKNYLKPKSLKMEEDTFFVIVCYESEK